ncbi:uncharacterized protein LOC120739090 [Simochromis diagramma]|uniref:uncharacterized protein LOC120739090 n=1 Tax=Simochromis diagramma TaxID=43689 RepID=UPI001A7ED6B9|nr:uncharacterized protein LOC120739090 [Simochromis diagramma]
MTVKETWDGTKATTSPVVKLKVPGVTTPSETVSHSSSAAPDVRVTQHPNAPYQAEYLPGNKDLDETTATTSPVVKLKVPGVTTPSETVSHSSSAAPDVRVTQHPNAPYQAKYLPGNKDLDETTATTSPVVKLPRVNTPSKKVSHRRSAHPCDRVKRQLNFPYQSFRHKRSTGNGPDNCCFKFYRRRIKPSLVESYYMTDHRCPKPAVIFITKPSSSICMDPSVSSTKILMKILDWRSF